MKSTEKSYLGHRERTKCKFLEHGKNLLDYELLELTLFYSIPRKDVKDLAKALIKHFGSYANVINAKPEELTSFTTISKNTLTLFKLLKESAITLAKQEINNKPIISNWQQMLDYCYVSMAHEKNELVKIIYLNTKGIIIKDEVIQEGTINQANFYPRTIIKRALDLGAASIIIVHNHPSGDPTPSESDIVVTYELANLAKGLEITVFDHLIIGKNGISSFKKLGLF